MSCEVSSNDPNLIGCTIQFPRANTLDVPVPSGADGILSWDDSVPEYVHTGILPFQLENVVGRQLPITGAATPTTILTLTFGTFHVLINPPASDHPTVAFTISKTDPASNSASSLIVHSGSIPSSGNIFQVLWPAGSGVQIQKTLPSEDGNYQVTISGI